MKELKDDVVFLRKLIVDNKVNVIFNTAAYKHVPLVESNPIQGIKNNCLSTFKLCELANQLKIDQLIQQEHLDESYRDIYTYYSKIDTVAEKIITNKNNGNRKIIFSHFIGEIDEILIIEEFLLECIILITY